MRSIDQTTADLEQAFGLPEEALFFDTGPKGSDGWVCIPAAVAEQLIAKFGGASR